MARRVLQYWEYDDAGGSTYYTPGHIDGGDFDNDGAIVYEDTANGTSQIAPGMVGGSGSIEFRPTATTFLAKCLRTNPTSQLQTLDIRVGTSAEAYVHEDSMCNNLRLSCAAGERLKATVDWISMAPHALALPTWKGPHSGNPFHWYSGTVTLGGVAYTMQSFDVNVNNNVRCFTSMDYAAAYVRYPEEIINFSEEVTLTAVVAVPLSTNALDIFGVPTATGVASLAFTSATPTTLTISLANLTLARWRKPTVVQDVVLWTLDYTAEKNNASSITIA